MARKGRELEELVAALEKGLGSTDIKVTSPDQIEDKTTKEKREVDVSLKGKIGSNEILIIIECRDRKSKQDVTWIEQIATKRDDIGAHKAIAVSSSGFSEAAKNKAIAKNIELRTMEEIDPKEIIEWFQAKEVTIYNQRFRFLRADILPHKCLDNSQIEELHKFLKSFSGAFPCDTKFIIDPEADAALSLSDCILRNADKIFEGFKPPTDEKTVIHLAIVPQNKEAGFFASTPNGLIRMEHIEIKLEIWLEVTKTNITSVSSYDIEGHFFSSDCFFRWLRY
ncbi:hypothetical protein MSSAC_1432 [Methanosarcina siciliae C2J]|uniref:Restriction endonuclease type IV Mrr domain-containing protein n=1 Tax=Methanosarcina siciliae C2J TaxID=1434118 RepID=A0A0E3PNE8_9EURY|nr:restriction endonuclease [Methanosarcina siciliae]AKB36022.1 hypothetical protein MSSAC_1432 [Methanosarcina siciliae C2J]